LTKEEAICGYMEKNLHSIAKKDQNKPGQVTCLGIYEETCSQYPTDNPRDPADNKKRDIPKQLFIIKGELHRISLFVFI